MTPDSENPTITPFLRAFTFVEALVLLTASIAFFFFPDLTRPLWPWKIAPFNTRFLGAVYFGALLPVATMAISSRWSPTRPVLRAIFTFTFIVLLVSLWTSSLFDFSSVVGLGWFALYISLPISAGYHLWLYCSMPTSHLHAPSRNWQKTLTTTSIVLGLYGLGLIVMPTTFSKLFPWNLDVFHSQLYSATFITAAVMLATISKRATSAEFVAVGSAETAFAVMSILGLIIVDFEVHKIDWSAFNTLAWMASFLAIAVLGITLLWAGLRGTPEKMKS